MTSLGNKPDWLRDMAHRLRAGIQQEALELEIGFAIEPCFPADASCEIACNSTSPTATVTTSKKAYRGYEHYLIWRKIPVTSDCARPDSLGVNPICNNANPACLSLSQH